MVEQRTNLDYGADDTSLTDEVAADETTTVEGDGFTMTETAEVSPSTPTDRVDDVDETNEEADTLGAP
jgi:hypothetical protein